ncbi:MAG TPA: patatin-like phospholipase family protein [Flavobacterium sp.]|jgi:NTE family protein
MKKFLLLVMVLFGVLTLFAQEQKKPLKVGLVLSGGGAKGFAHIGVLKVLEEAGVKVSYIGGTSMGAVVGGLYASGYNARQIDSIFRDTDFDALLQDYIPRSSKNFFGKRNDELYALSLPFNKFRIGIPTALSKGLYNYNLLTRLTHNVRHVRNFNELPIPFLCMATDIETGDAVLLDKGFLPQAMAASAAFPSLFSPVEIDGRLLVDGGVTNNYPIDEIKKLGADFIIGVDVQDDLKDRNSLKDATRILVQISNLQMIQAMSKKAAETDIYIKPDISSFSVISFAEGPAIVKKGEEAARAVFERIQKAAEKPQYVKKPATASNDTIHLSNISISKLDNYTRAYIMGKLRMKPGWNVSYDNLKVGIDNLSATQNFSAIGYSLEQNPGGGDDLKLDLVENPVRTYLKFGLHYDGLYKTSVLTNITNKKNFFKNDVLSLDVVLGDNFRYTFDYYIDNGFYFSFGLRSRFNQFNRNVATDFSEGELLDELGLNTINIDFSDVSNQAYLQTIFVQKFLLGGGTELKFLKIKSQTLENTNPVFENSSYISLFGYLKYDSFDNRYFPKKGWYFAGDFQWYLKSSDYTRRFERFSIAKADAGIAQTFFKKWTLKLNAEAGVTFGEDSVPFFDFILGGYGFSPVNNIRPFYGYDFLSLSGDTYLKAAGTIDFEFLKKNHLNFSANGAAVGDNLFETSRWFTSEKKHTGYAIGYGMETIIGPLEIKYTWSPELSRSYTWISVGFWF